MNQEPIEILLNGQGQTSALGMHIGAAAMPGDIITLAGNLGAGKTTITQAIGRGAGVPDWRYITSPSFGLLHEYCGRIPFYHMDLYRLGGEEEIEDLGFEEYLHGNGVAVVEWPDRLGSLMPEERLHIDLEIKDMESRIARLVSHGVSWKKRLAELALID